MKYTKEQRIDIGRQVYTHELSHTEAMAKYGVVSSAIDNYVRLYKITNGIPTNTFLKVSASTEKVKTVTRPIKTNVPPDIEAYQAMTKEELINELIRAKANELRAKKGYEVKGVGANKEFISLSSKNTKS